MKTIPRQGMVGWSQDSLMSEAAGTFSYMQDKKHQNMTMMHMNVMHDKVRILFEIQTLNNPLVRIFLY